MPLKQSVFPLRRGPALLAALALALPLAGCLGLGKKADTAAVEESPDLLYNQGLALMNAGDTSKAGDKFDAVTAQNPYSNSARRSIMLAAFIKFRKGDYQESINEAQRYVALYPQSPDAAYAQYLIGESYFRQIPDVTRDQDLSKKAIEAMTLVTTKYPESEYADDARLKADRARDQIAGKEMQIGRYYQERREYLASVNRFKNVVTNYQTTRHVEEALLRLTESYLALGIVPEAQAAAAVLGHNFPDSEWYQEAYRLLGKAGVAPKSNESSWMSRIFRGDRDA